MTCKINLSDPVMIPDKTVQLISVFRIIITQ